MDRQTARDDYEQRYQKTGVVTPVPLVDQVMENKHGIDNPVTDLKVTQQKIAGNVFFDGSVSGSDLITITLQDQDGVMVLQAQQTLTTGRIPFADITGRLTEDSDLSFAGDTLLATKLLTTEVKDSSLTATRVVFAGASGVLSDDADLTFDGTTLTAAQLKSPSLTAGRVAFAGSGGLLTDDADMTFSGDTLTVTKLTTTLLTATTTRWKDVSALAGVGFTSWQLGTDGLNSVLTGDVAVFPITYEDGSTLTQLRVKYAGSNASTGVKVSLRKRDESGTTTTYTLVGTQQTFHNSGTKVDTYNFSDEVMGANDSYEILVESDVDVAQNVTLYAVGIESSARIV